MELIRETIRMCCQGKRVCGQIVLEEDVNVSDSKPDVEKIIQNKARVMLENTRTDHEKIYIKGKLQVGILYMDDTTEHMLHRMDAQIPFEEVLTMEGLETGTPAEVSCDIEDMSTVIINSRKLSMRSLLTLTAETDHEYDVTAASGVTGNEEFCLKKKTVEFMNLDVSKKDILRIKEEFLLPSNKPEIDEIVWETIRLSGCEVHVEEKQLRVEGELFLFLLYRAADDGGTLQWLERTVPFEQTVKEEHAGTELIPDVAVRLGQTDIIVKSDEDGEDRKISLEISLNMSIRLYSEQKKDILVDVFAPQKELKLFTREEGCESLVMRSCSRIRVIGRLRTNGTDPDILQVCSSQGSVKTDEAIIEPGGIRLEGAITAQLFYVTPEDMMPFAVLEGSIPFSHFADIRGIDSDCRFHLQTSLEQLSTAMADSEEIEIRAAVSIRLLVVRPYKLQCIVDMEEKEADMLKLQELPGITGYLVQPGDTLWEIARMYATTPERIMKMNGLETDVIQPGDQLIIMKEFPANGV